MRPRPAFELRLMHWLIPAVGFAALCSGIVFWLRRVGWLQRETYWSAYHHLIDEATRTPTWERYLEVVSFESSFHALEGSLWLSKLPKELVWLAVITAAALTAQQARSQPRALLLAYGALFALVAVAATEALAGARWIDLLAGTRSFLCWLLAAIGVALSTPELRRRLTHVLILVMVVQGLMAPIELTLALKIYKMALLGHDYPRVVGSFGLPLSLGVFTVVSWAMAACWGGLSQRSLGLLSLLVAALLLANGSATAWVMFIASAGVYVLNRQGQSVRLVILLLALPAAVLVWHSLPQLTGRSTIHESLFGRVLAIKMHATENLSSRELLFGDGFGLGTNAHSRLTPQRAGTSTIDGNNETHAVGDSMPASLLWQTGLVGLALAYGLMLAGLAMNRNDQAIGVALILASLTLNIAELFPVNLILGLWLAGAWIRPGVLEQVRTA